MTRDIEALPLYRGTRAELSRSLVLLVLLGGFSLALFTYSSKLYNLPDDSAQRFRSGQITAVVQPGSSVAVEYRASSDFYSGRPSPLMLGLTVTPPPGTTETAFAIFFDLDARVDVPQGERRGSALPRGERRGDGDLWVQGASVASYSQDLGDTILCDRGSTVVWGSAPVSSASGTAKVSLVGPSASEIFVPNQTGSSFYFPDLGLSGAEEVNPSPDTSSCPVSSLTPPSGRYLFDLVRDSPARTSVKAVLGDLRSNDKVDTPIAPSKIDQNEWTWEKSDTELKIFGQITRQESISQQRRNDFLSAAYAGVAGGAALWTIEVFASLAGRVRWSSVWQRVRGARADKRVHD